MIQTAVVGTSAALPTATGLPPKSIAICVSQEPTSLYVYGEPLMANLHLKQAVMDGPIDFLHFQYHPVLFDELPTIENGGATLVQAPLEAGDEYVETDGSIQTWEGDPGVRPQLVVTFTMKSGLLWADGAPLTADDSVFSFEVASSPATLQTKYRTLRTQSYTGLDERRTEWVGLQIAGPKPGKILLGD